MQGETLNIPTMAGISLKQNEFSMQTASNIGQTKVNEVGKIDFTLSLFDLINLKDVHVNIIPKTTVIPMGVAIRNETLYRWSISGGNDRNRGTKTL